MIKEVSLRKLLIISLSVCIALAVTLQGILIYSISSDEITANVTQIASEKLSSQTSSVGQYMTSLENMAYAISTSDIVWNSLLLKGQAEEFYQKLTRHDASEEFLRRLAFSYDDIAGVFILTEYDYGIPHNTNYTFRSAATVEDLDFYSYIYDNAGSGYIPIVDTDLLINTSAEDVFCYYNKMFSSEGHIATVCIFVDKAYFENVQATLGETQANFMVTNGDNVVYADDDIVQRFDNNIDVLNEANNIVLSERLDNGWEIVNIVPSTQIEQSSTRILQYVLIGTLLAFLLNLVFFIFISHYLTRSLHKLNRKMADVGLQPYTFNEKHLIKEVSMLNEQYNEMERRISELMTQIRLEQKEIDKAHIEILQAQINPHFLYNTLDAINWMAIERDADDISAMTSSLANLFRYGLNGGNEITTLANEINHLEAYIEIQKHRYNNRFTFKKSVDEELLHSKTLNIILQPVVENCFVHGFRDNKDRINITLNVKSEDDSLIFIISDDGVGSDHNALNEQLYSENNSNKSYGVKNIHRRIQLNYGEGYGVKYLESNAEGVRVRLCIPLIDGGNL